MYDIACINVFADLLAFDFLELENQHSERQLEQAILMRRQLPVCYPSWIG